MVVQTKFTARDEELARQLMFLIESMRPARVTITVSGQVAYVVKVNDNEALLMIENVPDRPAKFWYRLDEIELYEPEYD